VPCPTIDPTIASLESSEKHLAEKKKMQAVAEKREREARAAAAVYVSKKEWTDADSKHPTVR